MLKRPTHLQQPPTTSNLLQNTTQLASLNTHPHRDGAITSITTAQLRRHHINNFLVTNNTQHTDATHGVPHGSRPVVVVHN